MSRETILNLMAAGREDLIHAFQIAMSGWGGVDCHGSIVDRRDVPKAISIPMNFSLDIPYPIGEYEEDPDFFAGGGYEY